MYLVYDDFWPRVYLPGRHVYTCDIHTYQQAALGHHQCLMRCSDNRMIIDGLGSHCPIPSHSICVYVFIYCWRGQPYMYIDVQLEHDLNINPRIIMNGTIYHISWCLSISAYILTLILCQPGSNSDAACTYIGIPHNTTPIWLTFTVFVTIR